MSAGNDTVAIRFLVDITSATVELAVDEIWPDGGAPENPTAADVIAVMRESSHDRIARLLIEWNLDSDQVVSVSKLGGTRDMAEWRG